LRQKHMLNMKEHNADTIPFSIDGTVDIL
jgi:hypothetical protein